MRPYSLLNIQDMAILVFPSGEERPATDLELQMHARIKELEGCVAHVEAALNALRQLSG